jgi:hypothetical protein
MTTWKNGTDPDLDPLHGMTEPSPMSVFRDERCIGCTVRRSASMSLPDMGTTCKAGERCGVGRAFAVSRAVDSAR